jgi:hydrogenase maturation protease
MTARWTILVCGDRSRGDDGAALAAADVIAAALPRGVALRRVGQLEPDDLVAAVDGGSCLVLDVVRGVAPGSVIRLPLGRLGTTGEPAPATTHALPLRTVAGIAGALGADLGRATFLGIGGLRFGLGEGLSDEVLRRLDGYIRRIEETVAGAVRRCA